MAKSKKLKLYVWTEVLYDWSSGIAFALTESPEKAVEEVKKGGLNFCEDRWDGIKLDGKLPTEYVKSVGFYMYGSS